jgi:hypothetical protein
VPAPARTATPAATDTSNRTRMATPFDRMFWPRQ